MISSAVSLFDGIGGFPLALGRAGIETVATVEIDAACRGVTERNLAPHRQFSDVQGVMGSDLSGAGFERRTGILTAGWPCQGNSVAGSRGGMADPRSGLWREVVRLLRDTRPRWFLGENVPGLLSVHRGLDFQIVKESLEELGYGLAWRVLDAQHFGVPQRRRRVFIAGCLGDGARPAEVLFEPEGRAGDSAPGREARSQAAGTAVVGTLQSGFGTRGYSADGVGAGHFVVSTLQGGGRRGYRVDAEAAAGNHLVCVTGEVTHTLRAEGCDASEDGTGRGTPIIAHALTTSQTRFDKEQTWDPCLRGGVRRLTPRECERLQGFPDDWTAGQSDSARYRQLGNAVAVPVVEWIARRIVAADATSNPKGE